MTLVNCTSYVTYLLELILKRIIGIPYGPVAKSMKGLLDFFVFTIEQVINMHFSKQLRLDTKLISPGLLQD